MGVSIELSNFVEVIIDKLEDEGARIKVGVLKHDGGDFIIDFEIIARDEDQDAVERILNRMDDRVDNDRKDISFNDETPETPNKVSDTFELKCSLLGEINLFDI